jgi:hypothetical protein
MLLLGVVAFGCLCALVSRRSCWQLRLTIIFMLAKVHASVIMFVPFCMPSARNFRTTSSR